MMVQPNDPETDVEAVNTTTTSTSDGKALEDKSEAAAVEADADVPSTKKPGYFTVRNLAYGLAGAVFIAGGATAAGAGIAGAIKATQQVNLQSQKASWDPSSKSSKSKSGKADFLECVIEPLAYLVTDGCNDVTDVTASETITKKEFKNVWNPYIDECADFWANVFYLLTRIWLFSIGKICALIDNYKEGWNDNIVQIIGALPTVCPGLLPDGANVYNVVGLIIKNEANTDDFVEGVVTCAKTVLMGVAVADINLLSQFAVGLISFFGAPFLR